ncbi:MAG: hypothetical protein MAG794_01497 [Gammaproteobacteria bacterium]|nr:hypothetical protein [Gammaproteobacteria bacterium]
MPGIKITVISGSHRNPSQSYKVAALIRRQLLDNAVCEDAPILSLADNPLPLWDQGIWEGDRKWGRLLDPIHAQCRDSHGFVVVSPEWHGQAPAGLKNLFLCLSQREVGHKPALIVTVSAGSGGAYPVAELRMSSYKNNRLCYIPEHVIVRNVEKVLNDDPAENDAESDSYYRERLLWALGILKEYAVALNHVRKSGATTTREFKNGM